MKKIVITLILLIACSTSLFAQRFERKGFALGADRDTLLYIIASPFDNWWINLGGGLQTYIGNTPDSKAAWNKVDLGLRVEVGKWIIPDLAVSLRLGIASAHSKSRHGGNNPLTDISHPVNYSGAEYGPYYPISACIATFMGYVTFDWTNFFHGYEQGKRRRWHFYTPIGLGGAVMIGEIVNPNYVNKVNNNPNEEDVELNDLSRNFELSFSGGFTTEYYASKHISLNATIDLLMARGSLDDYNYNLDADIRRVDLIPSIYFGAKFNLLKNVTKYNPYTHTSSREVVNHEFLPAGSRNTLPRLMGKIERLGQQIDSILNQSGDREHQDSIIIDSLINELHNANNTRDSLIREGGYGAQPHSVIDELLNTNEVLNLPAAIVYYQLDKWDLDYNATKRLEGFYKKARHLDDTVKFYIIGAADSVTGSIRHNQWLSEHRSKAAFDMLVELGMNAKQLIPVSIGGIMHYDPKENNRMALVIQRTPVTEEIVERWLRQSKERLKK